MEMKKIVVDDLFTRTFFRIDNSLMKVLLHLDLIDARYCHVCKGYHAWDSKKEIVLNVLSDHPSHPVKIREIL